MVRPLFGLRCNANVLLYLNVQFFFSFWVGMSLYFSSQNSQYKSGSGAIEVLLPGACSKTLA